ncbi:hypothetical protein D7B12_18095 [Salmonella enterica]|nr:hypothetical protein [Salmonella enterica]
MLFKWQYSESPGLGRSDFLKMGAVTVGELYQTSVNCWRAICHLPDSSRWGNNFIDDFPSKGQASNALEMICAQWLSKSGLWTVLDVPDTLALNESEQG